MRMFLVEVSAGTLRVIRRACANVRVAGDEFTDDELICLRDCIQVFDQHLGEDDE